MATARIVAMIATCIDSPSRLPISSITGPAGPHRDAEIADEDAGHPVDELPPQRLVEAEADALGGDAPPA